MSDKLIIILSIDLLIFLLLLKLIFGSIKEIKRCLYYLIKPDILSIIDKDFDKDISYTTKFIFIIVLIFIIGLIEFYFFYP